MIEQLLSLPEPSWLTCLTAEAIKNKPCPLHEILKDGASWGGYPSPIMPNGRLLSLPVPSNDGIIYNDISLNETASYYDIMRNLNPRSKLSTGGGRSMQILSVI